MKPKSCIQQIQSKTQCSNRTPQAEFATNFAAANNEPMRKGTRHFLLCSGHRFPDSASSPNLLASSLEGLIQWPRPSAYAATQPGSTALADIFRAETRGPQAADDCGSGQGAGGFQLGQHICTGTMMRRIRRERVKFTKELSARCTAPAVPTQHPVIVFAMSNSVLRMSVCFTLLSVHAMRYGNAQPMWLLGLGFLCCPHNLDCPTFLLCFSPFVVESSMHVRRRSLGNPSMPAHTPPPPSAPIYFRSRSHEGPTPPAQEHARAC